MSNKTMCKVVHFEIPANNIERAKKFYSDIFGWQMIKTPMADDFYLVNTVETDEKGMPKTSGAINGDIMKRTSKEETPIIVIKVPSMDEYLKKLKNAGCKVVIETQQIGGMGLYSRFIDPEGNIIGMWQDLETSKK